MGSWFLSGAARAFARQCKAVRHSAFILAGVLTFSSAWASTTVNESFSPSVINQGDTSTYTLTLVNDSTTPLSNAALTVFLDNSSTTPNSSGGNVSITNGTVLSNSCGFSGVTAAQGANSIVLTGGTVPAGTISAAAQCTFSLSVTSTTVGTFHAYIPANTTPSATVAGYQATENTVTVNNGTSADVTLQVNGVQPPVGTKSYSVSPAVQGDATQLTITLSNPNSSVTMPLTTFTDALPSPMVVADASGTVSCSGTGASNGTLTATQGASSISLAGGVIGAGGACTLRVNVVVPTLSGTSQTLTNSLPSGAIGNTRGLTSAAFSQALTVNSPVTVSKSFNPTTIPAGQPTLLTLVIGNTSASQTLPVSSFQDDMSSGSITVLTSASGISGVTDPTVSCTGTGAINGTVTATNGGSTIGLSGTTVGVRGQCTVQVYATSSVDGQRTNSIPANAVSNPNNYASPAAQASFQDNAQLTVSKTVTVSQVAPGQWTQFTVTINNYSGGPVTGVSFLDTLPAASGAQMVLNGANPTNTSAGCSGGTWSGADGASSLSWTGGIIVGGSGANPGVCIITFQARLPANANTGLSFNNQIPAASITGTGPNGAVSNTNADAANVTSVSSAAVGKSFNPSSIAQGGLSTLTITISNRTLSPLTTVNLTDALPSGVVLAANPAATNTCGGSLSAAPSASSVVLTGGNLAARPNASTQSSCTITVKVTGSTLGSYTNSIAPGDFSNDQSASFSTNATATLNVTTGLSATKAFSPTSIASGGTSRVTLTISNASTGQLSNVSLNDSGFAARLTVANPANAATSCAGAPTFVANPGAGSAQLFGATLAAGASCQFSFDVTASGSGPWTNTVPAGQITSAQGISSTAAVTATLSQAAAQININKSFNPVVVTGGVPSTLTLTLTNPSSVALHGVSFSDVFPSGIQVYSVPSVSSTCTGSSITAVPGSAQVSVRGVTMAANSSCTITLQATSVKFLNLTNNIPAGAINSEEGYTNPTQVSATLSTLQGLSVMKGFEPAYVVPNAITTLKMTLVSTFDPNAPTPMVLTGVSYTDTLPAGLVLASTPNASTTCPGPGGNGSATITANAGSNLVTVSAAQLAPSTTCTVSVNVLAPSSLGTYTNLIPANAITTDQGQTNSNPASAPLYVVNQPTVSKAFSPSSVSAGQSATLTVTISNGASVALTGLALSDSLPSGMVIAATPAASTTCANGSVTAQAGTASLSVAGASIPANGSCTFQAAVTANQAGSYNNGIPSGQITDDQGLSNPGAASATLTVLNAPTVSKAFAPNSIAVNGISQLTITLGNTNASAITLNSTFVDALPAGVVIAATPGIAGSCPAGSVTAQPGASSLSYANGASIAAGGCTITVNVTSSSAGLYTDLIAAGQLSTNAGTNPSAATAQLSVGGTALSPTLAKSFSPSTIAVNGLSTLTLSLGNPNATPQTLAANLVDNLPSGVVIAAAPTVSGSCDTTQVQASPGGTSVTYATNATVPSGGCTITVAVTSASAGSYTNTIAAGALQTTDGGASPQAAVAGLVVQGSVPPTVQKSFTPNTINPGGTSVLTITLGNANASAATLTSAFVDTLPTNVIVASLPALGGSCTLGSVTAAAAGNTVSYASGATLPAGGCTITVNVTSSVPGGPYINTIASGALQTTLGNNVAGATANLFVNPAQPPSLSKSFSPTLIGVGGTTTLTLSFGNGNASATSLSSNLVDTLPANLVVAAVPNIRVSTGCTLASVVATAGASSISYQSGGAIPAGGCTVSVDLSTSTAGSYTNTIAAGALQTGAGNSTVGTSASLTVTQLPTVTKAFSPTRILAGSSATPSTLTITLGNTNAQALTLSAALVDSLPSGVQVANPSGLTTTCPGAVSAAAGAAQLSYPAGASLPSGGCIVSVNVVAPTTGVYTNLIATGALQTNGGKNPAPTSAILTALAAPSLGKAFSPAAVQPSGSSQLTLSLGNTNSTALTLSSALADNLPTGLLVAAQPQLGGSCPGAVSASRGGTTVSYASGSTIPAGGCTITVMVTAAQTGTYVNTLAPNALQTDGGGNPAQAQATLSVMPASVPTMTSQMMLTMVGLMLVLGLAALGPNGKRK